MAQYTTSVERGTSPPARSTPSAGTRSVSGMTTDAADPFAGMLAQIGAITGVGGDPESEAKAKSKADKQLAELQGKIQKQLAEQQAKYAMQLQAQQQAASLAQQIQQQGWQSQWNAAELLGTYNGQETLASKQLGQNKYEFDVTARQQEEMNVLKREISNREMALAELTQEQNNAIQRGELELAREMQTRKVALEEELGRGQLALEKMQMSGYMDNGQLTEAARAARRQEAMRQAEITGVYTDPETGEQMGLTDAAQQWRSQLGLDYARTAAQLAQSPADYFESAAFMRGAEGSGAVGFLNTINQTGMGSNQGFRSAQQGLPQVNSMQNIAQGGNPAGGVPINDGQMTTQVQGVGQGAVRPYTADGPSGSIAAAQSAADGNPETFTSTMHTDPMQPQFQAAQANMPTQQPVYGTQAQQRLAAFAPVFQAGAHKLAPGALESMSPTEKGLFTSAAKASGINPADFEEQYKRSRLQTGVSATAI